MYKEAYDVGLLKALADETRKKIVIVIRLKKNLSVFQIAQEVNISQPNASQALGALRYAGVVVSKRHGHEVHYRLSDKLAGRIAALARLFQ